MSSIIYETCCQAWRGDVLGGGVTSICLEDGTLLGRFPISFLMSGGRQTCRKSYLQKIAKILTCAPDDATIRLDHEDYPADDDDSDIRVGVYIFTSSSAPRLAVGPQGKSLSRPYRDSDYASTVSRSSRSSANQSRFRLNVLFRDGRCLATDNQDPASVIAAHIVPFSLGQSYLDSVTRFPGTVGLFSVSNGLTMRRDLHSKYDSYEWGIYVAGNEHVIHVFGDSNHEMHGRVIDYGRANVTQLPNTDVLMWQYKQCLLARIRGYYVAPS